MSRIVIIGAGVVGLSVARAALKRGHQVTILEQGTAPNPQAASFDLHRMIRYPYGSAQGYTRMVTQAFGAWDRVWADLGTTHFENTGAIAISLEAGDYAQKTLDSFKAVGQPHEVLSRDGVEKLCPHLTLPEGAWGLVSFPGGPLFASRIVTELAQWVRDHGGVIEHDCRVAHVDLEAGIATRADGSQVEGDLLLVAAGAWLPGLMPDRFGDASVYRQGLCYVEPPAQYEQSWRDAPAIACIGDHTGYTLPDRRGAGLKIGYSAHRRLARPEVDGFGSDLDSESSAILGAFKPYFRDFEAYRPTRIQVGYYVLDASRRFKVEQAGRGLVVTNCDGQMFKFGPLLGERIIGMFAGEESAADLAHWAAGY
ncbi:NAD(P)/FAD-dependent oxidoreductase [Bosea lathyri]|uniref:Sarcosine oxidase n=1 Tax=Bosea lathyri TaxID=1036778 RepID=A0A1H5S0X4_9HYPH|nr:FAD-binding oxidoreductase [Bosea lathyri]SEF43568.1 sarcosine oxidase [Bosea lathyri]